MRVTAHRESLNLQLELLKPYFDAGAKDTFEACEMLKARLESGDKVEQARYQDLMLRGFKQKSLQ